MIILVPIIILILYILVEYNIIAKRAISVEHAKSVIEVYLNQRFDLIPKLIECVKSYKKYEKELFEKITKLRAEYMKNKNLQKGALLDTEVNKILSVLEVYPELKASEQFLNLQKNLTKMENQIQASRRLYNVEVEKYNNNISIFPNKILANILKFKKEEFFKMEEK